VFTAHRIPDAGGNTIGKISEILVLHSFGEGDKLTHQTAHFIDFFVAPAAALAVGPIVGACASAGFEYHGNLRSLESKPSA
jgi:hypothetical protein